MSSRVFFILTIIIMMLLCNSLKFIPHQIRFVSVKDAVNTKLWSQISQAFWFLRMHLGFFFGFFLRGLVV